MKLILYDKCWDAIIKLPKTVQKKVADFICKFQENSKSAAIHLEPISTFRDPQLRTARVDLKYRAVIRVPQEGDVYHFLWVDNHDEAMNWAANKLFSWNENTQSFQVFVAPEAIETPELAQKGTTSSTRETSFLDQFSDVDLQKIGVPVVLLPAIRQIKNIDDLGAMEKFLPVEAFENLFFLFDGESLERIISEIEEGKVNSEEFEIKTQSPNNQRSFFELTSDEQLNEMLSGELQKWKIYLHPSQRTLVSSHFPGSVRISGGAGTGKTVAAIHRAKFLLDLENGRPTKPILFTTYTKSLTRNLEKELPGLNIDLYKVKVLNIDALAIEEAKRLGLIPEDVRILNFPGNKNSQNLWEEVLDYEVSPFDGKFLDEEYRQVILLNHIKTAEDYFRTPRTGRSTRLSRKDRMQVWQLTQKYQQIKFDQRCVDKEEVFNLLCDYYQAMSEKPFSYIIADEIQDFSNVELRLLRALVEEKPNDLFLVGDPLQQIYNRTLNFTRCRINVRGRRSRRLKINYRTTEEIRRAAIAAINDIPFDDFDGEEESKKGYVSLRRGLRPDYTVFQEKAQELNFILKKIYEYTDPGRADAFLLSDICIAAHTRSGVKDIRSRLHQEKLPFYDLTSDLSTGNREMGIRLSTFHSIKGLEFKAVFLIDVNSRTLPLRPFGYEQWDESARRQHEKQELALAYVAMTRAVHVVHVTGVGEKSGVIKV